MLRPVLLGVVQAGPPTWNRYNNNNNNNNNNNQNRLKDHYLKSCSPLAEKIHTHLTELRA